MCSKRVVEAHSRVSRFHVVAKVWAGTNAMELEKKRSHPAEILAGLFGCGGAYALLISDKARYSAVRRQRCAYSYSRYSTLITAP